MAAKPLLAVVPIMVLYSGALACKHPVDSGPQSGQFTIDFPSTPAAVMTDSLQAFVFDSADATNLCHELVSARSAQNKWLATPLAKSDPFPPCKLITSPGSVTLPPTHFGERAIVVVGQSGGTDILIGCRRVTFGDEDVPTVITLTLIGQMGLKPTSCTTLREHCDGKEC